MFSKSVTRLVQWRGGSRFYMADPTHQHRANSEGMDYYHNNHPPVFDEAPTLYLFSTKTTRPPAVRNPGRV